MHLHTFNVFHYHHQPCIYNVSRYSLYVNIIAISKVVLLLHKRAFTLIVPETEGYRTRSVSMDDLLYGSEISDNSSLPRFESFIYEPWWWLGERFSAYVALLRLLS